VSLQQIHSGHDTIAVAAKEFHLHQGESVELRPLHQLPSVPPAFTGREQELRDLETALTKQGNIGAAISASGGAGIQGMGGVGKTALATVLAHRLKDKYPDAQICLNLRGFDPTGRKPMQPVEAMQSIIRAFQPERKLPKTAEDLICHYICVLNEAGRVLLFLDNASNAEQIQPLLPPSNCLLLVTSRNQFSLPGLATRNIDCLPPEKSRELLHRLAKRIKDHEAITAAELCGHLPLALEVFAGAINIKSLTSVSELLERLRTQQEKLDAVDAAFQVSYELLGEELQKRWRLLAVFSASFDLRAAAAIWNEGPGRDALPRVQADQQVGPADSLNSAREAMQMLVNASLVEPNETIQRFRLHDLVRQFCNGKLSGAEREAAMMRYASHYMDVGWGTDQLYLKGGENVFRGLELFDRERVHIEAAFEWLAQRRDEPSAVLLISLVNAVVYTSHLRFHPRQSIRWLEGQREAARITKNRQYEGVALGNLGGAYTDLGQPRKAIEFFEQSLVIGREIGDRRGEGADLGNLGNAYRNLGETRKAIKFYEQALVIAREVGDRRGEGNALGSLGLAYHNLGEPGKAIGYYEKRLVIARKIGDRFGEGNALGNLGNAYAGLNEWRKATKFYEQALVIAREIGDQRGEGNAFGGLGTACRNLGELRKGIGFYEQQLVITREIGHRSGEGNALFNSALVLDELNDRTQAIARAEAALQIFDAIEHPDAAKVRAQLEEWKGGKEK
jgi:tetratricopeptide (TPR) repeat protein